MYPSLLVDWNQTDIFVGNMRGVLGVDFHKKTLQWKLRHCFEGIHFYKQSALHYRPTAVQYK